MAEDFLGIWDDGIYVESVRAGSKAEIQYIEAGDRIISINGQELASDPSLEQYNRTLLENGFRNPNPLLKLSTFEGREFTAQIETMAACDTPVNLVVSDNINGHTDGEEIYISSGLLSSVSDDTNLALIIAHEMAHMIAGHANKTPSQALELEADRMALVLMARAGFDIESAVQYWEGTSHPHDGEDENSHPTPQARYENFKSELIRIQDIEDNSTLNFRP